MRWLNPMRTIWLRPARRCPKQASNSTSHDLQTGSITAVLQAIADQGHLLFGEHGVVPAVQSAFEHADTIGGFIVSLNDVIQFFLGNRDKKEPSKKEADQ